jgi:hypothetical protein
MMGARPGKSTGSRTRPGTSLPNTRNATKFLRESRTTARQLLLRFRGSGRKSKWEEIAMLSGCSVVELRQYTLHDGTRERLIDLFEKRVH